MFYKEDGGPRMNKDDQHLFRKYLQKARDNNPDCMTYVEWGSGGSTFWSLEFAHRVISIENHPDWCRKMLSKSLVQCAIMSGKLFYVCVDGGKIHKWGKPVNESTYKSGLYIDVLDNFSVRPDFVLVDGRYRVATALSAYKYMNKDGFVFVHDYAPRKQYQELEGFYKTVVDNSSASINAVARIFQMQNITETIESYRSRAW